MLTARFDQAFHYARQLHQNQVRKGTAIPYISHLMAVSALVLEHGGDENQAAFSNGSHVHRPERTVKPDLKTLAGLCWEFVKHPLKTKNWRCVADFPQLFSPFRAK